MIREGVMISNRYEIVNRIDTGGMADVYKAIDRVLNRYVAVKVLKQEFREDETFVKKFRSEAQAAAGLQHPNIVNVYDVAESQGLYYIVMELVEGITLKDYIQKKGRLTPKEVIGITLQVCAGIDCAHSNNIIHRDIKPQNIIISKEGKVKVTDFGIAKATSSNTISTNAMGSVHYTSPEQARGGFSDAKSDIYSLGITMYEMITGELPFDGDSTVSIALKHLQEDIEPPSERVSGVPYGLEQIILKCTQKSPDRRYINIAQLTRDLKRAVQDPHGDFVRISPLVSVGDTRTITQEELERIQGSVGYDTDYNDDYEDEYYDEKGKRRGSSRDEEDVEPGMSKLLKVLTIVAAVIFVGVLVWLFFGVIKEAGKQPNISQSSESYIVPKLVGMTEEEAQKACDDAGLKLDIRRRAESTEYEEGYIYYQQTAPGTKLVAGAYVQVYISSGKVEEVIEIPDVTGKTKEEAIIELVNAGFAKKNIKEESEESAKLKEDEVTRTEPAAGETGTKNSEIILYISNGKTKVPNLVGKTQEEAEKLLEEAGLKKGEVTVDKNSDAEGGQVISQVNKENEILEQGSKVNFTVSAGAEKVEIPSSLIGKHYNDVIDELGKLGFYKIETEGAMTSQYPREMVVSIENKNGDKITGKKVTLDTQIFIYVNEYMGADDTSGQE